MPSRPLLYSPGGQVIAVEHDKDEVKEATKDAVLIECFGIMNGVPAVINKWERAGGMEVATVQLSQIIVGLIGAEELGRRLGIHIMETVAPDQGPPVPEGMKTFDEVERAAAEVLRDPADAAREERQEDAPSSSGITRLRDWLKGGRR